MLPLLQHVILHAYHPNFIIEPQVKSNNTNFYDTHATSHNGTHRRLEGDTNRTKRQNIKVGLFLFSYFFFLLLHVMSHCSHFQVQISPYAQVRHNVGAKEGSLADLPSLPKLF